MGFVFCAGACITCGRLFTFNPVRVPSTRAFTGEREPVCQSCMGIINAKRAEQGLPPFEIPPDAYEAVSEDEL
jgi:hypothetical protein